MLFINLTDDVIIHPDSVRCAINDVKNTIKALNNTWFFNPKEIGFYTKVLTILESKL